MANSNQDELLEDWPRDSDGNILLEAGAAEKEEDKAARRDTLCLADLQIHAAQSPPPAIASTASIRKIHFSGTSQLYTYEREPLSLLRSLVYTDLDRCRFRKEAMQDGLLIKSLVEAPFPSVGESMIYLLRHGIFRRDEIVGIEHFYLGILPSQVAVIRRRHAAAVLRRQQQLLHEQEVENEDVVLSLGEFAQSSSLRSRQQARIRARIKGSANASQQVH